MSFKQKTPPPQKKMIIKYLISNKATTNLPHSNILRKNIIRKRFPAYAYDKSNSPISQSANSCGQPKKCFISVLPI